MSEIRMLPLPRLLALINGDNRRTTPTTRRTHGGLEQLRRRISRLVLILALAAFSIAAWKANPYDTDPGVKPGDDFYRYANGGWLKATTIPAGKPAYDTRAMLAEKTKERVRQLIESSVVAHAARGSVTQKVGDYYSSFMDQDSIEHKGLSPLAGELARIEAINDQTSLSAYLGTTLNSEVEGLVTNADHVFGIWINQGFEDSEHNLPHIWQGGLGLPDRDDYLDSSANKLELRNQYQAHIGRVLKLAGVADAETKAARILALEIRIAQAFAPDSDAADVRKQNNPWKRTDFASKAPGLDWDAYFQSAGLAQQRDFIVWQPSAAIGVAALVRTESTDAWKDYLRFHLLEHYASVLPAAVRAEHFAFYGTILSGAKQPPDRSEEAIAATNGALGQAVGKLYVARYFPPHAKARAQAMANDLISAYRERIPKLTWMAPETKQKAFAKLAALRVIVGYPDTWIDYSSLEVTHDAFSNMRRAETFYRLRNLARLKQPVVPIDWPINPQLPGAVIMFSPNAEFFSAAILQPPYFDADADSASNYGSAGAAMAHEITHSFDELGNIYDAQGRLMDWWTAEDRARYREAGTKLVDQFSRYCPVAELCVNGKQVLSENIADLAGLLVAHDAYVLSLKGSSDVVIGGLSGEQRFFLAFAKRWRKLQTETALRQQLKTDTHSPSEYRSDTVRNADAWYEAYKVAPGDKLYLKPEERARIW
jgi:predicted metalloendopeptidase